MSELFLGLTVKISNGIVSEPSAAAPDESDISNAQQTLLPNRRLMEDRLRQVISTSQAQHDATGQASRDVLLKWADTAMYHASDKGRNRMHLFQETPT